MEEIRSCSTYQTTTMRHVVTKNIAVLRSTYHFRSTEYKHNVITYLHQNTNYCHIFFKPRNVCASNNSVPQKFGKQTLRTLSKLKFHNYTVPGIKNVKFFTKNTPTRWVLNKRTPNLLQKNLPSPFGLRWQGSSWEWRRGRQLGGQIRRRGCVVGGRPPGGGSVRVHYQSVIAIP